MLPFKLIRRNWFSDEISLDIITAIINVEDNPDGAGGLSRIVKLCEGKQTVPADFRVFSCNSVFCRSIYFSLRDPRLQGLKDR